MKINIDLKEILHTRGKKDEENSMLLDQFFSLSFRKLADIGVNLLEHSKITPNQITVVRAIIFLPLIFYLFSKGTYIGNIFGVISCALNSLFDVLDGNLARAKFMTSKTGAWLDHNLDKIAVYLVLMGIIIGTYKHTQNNIFLILGIIILFLHALIVNVSNDYDSMFGEEIYFDLPLKEAIYQNDKSTWFDKISLNLFVFNSFWTYFLFAIRYQVLSGAVFNIMPFIIYYWIFAFILRILFLWSVYLLIIRKEKSRFIFINELKKRLKNR